MKLFSFIFNNFFINQMNNFTFFLAIISLVFLSNTQEAEEDF